MYICIQIHMEMKRFIIGIIFFFSIAQVSASYILIPMDKTQRNHLKAYGIAYWALSK